MVFGQALLIALQPLNNCGEIRLACFRNSLGRNAIGLPLCEERDLLGYQGFGHLSQQAETLCDMLIGHTCYGSMLARVSTRNQWTAVMPSLL